MSSDLWLLQRDVVYGRKQFGLTREEMVSLYEEINGLPKLVDVVRDWEKKMKQIEEEKIFGDLEDLPSPKRPSLPLSPTMLLEHPTPDT
ncbi:hypothetical protein V6N11_062406 [Hibiscus sabdariffa]|uniref:Uncharacterized protein n=1 Tax=Hibiscus sabdariffa TaxID=183260 RepID=A0ABR2PSF2_9ROSI